MFYQPRRLKVNSKTGFRNMTNGRVLIHDSYDRPFYDTREIDNVVYRFNLPEGEYILREGMINRLPTPVDYPLLPLPYPERIKRKNPENFKVLFAPNPHKCTVDWRGETITYDTVFKHAPLPILVLIYQHEIGHRFYNTENYCDRFAHNYMITAGYNPSQIGIPFCETLSDNAYDRKIDLIESMLKQARNYESSKFV